MKIRLVRACFALSLTLVFGTGCKDEEFGDLYFVKLKGDAADVASTTKLVSDAVGIKIIHSYDAGSEGFSTRMPDFLADEVKQHPDVKYIRKAPSEDWSPDDEDPEFVEPPASEIPTGIARVMGAASFNDMSNRSIEVAVMAFIVSVPVLSLLITVVPPSVSTSVSDLTTALCSARRCAPDDNMSCTHVGSPVGMAEIAVVIASKISVSVS